MWLHSCITDIGFVLELNVFRGYYRGCAIVSPAPRFLYTLIRRCFYCETIRFTAKDEPKILYQQAGKVSNRTLQIEFTARGMLIVTSKYNATFGTLLFSKLWFDVGNPSQKQVKDHGPSVPLTGRFLVALVQNTAFETQKRIS